MNGGFGVIQIIRQFPGPVAMTWLLVLLENVLLALTPLLIGLAIDGLLAGKTEALLQLGMVLAGLTLVAVGRRAWDTRAYGTIRVALGGAVQARMPDLPVSALNARLDMARELVDFLEQELPQLMTALVQIVVALVVLASFSDQLLLSSLSLLLAMIALYSLFHRRFYRLNAALNAQTEKQVQTLSLGSSARLLLHLKALRSWEVRLSDTEALVYGLIFLLISGFLVFNLWHSAALPAISPGRIFSIVSYSWEYAEAAIALPVTLQSWSRLSEISQRLNSHAKMKVTT